LLIGEKGPYMLAISDDDMPHNPREDDHFGKMVCFHSRYRLGDKHDFENPDDFLYSLLTNTLGSHDTAYLFRSKVQDSFDPKAIGRGAYYKAVDDKLLETIKAKYVILPLYLLDHSGITISTSDFRDPWDSGQIGWVYAAKNAVLREYGGQSLTAEKRAKAENLMRGEVEYYCHYLRGDCMRFELYKNGKFEDSLWGFIGDFDQICKDIENNLPEACKGITSNLTEKPDRISVLAFLKDAGAQIAAMPSADRNALIHAAVR